MEEWRLENMSKDSKGSLDGDASREKVEAGTGFWISEGTGEARESELSVSVF